MWLCNTIFSYIFLLLLPSGWCLLWHSSLGKHSRYHQNNFWKDLKGGLCYGMQHSYSICTASFHSILQSIASLFLWHQNHLPTTPSTPLLNWPPSLLMEPVLSAVLTGSMAHKTRVDLVLLFKVSESTAKQTMCRSHGTMHLLPSTNIVQETASSTFNCMLVSSNTWHQLCIFFSFLILSW